MTAPMPARRSLTAYSGLPSEGTTASAVDYSITGL